VFRSKLEVRRFLQGQQNLLDNPNLPNSKRKTRSSNVKNSPAKRRKVMHSPDNKEPETTPDKEPTETTDNKEAKVEDEGENLALPKMKNHKQQESPQSDDLLFEEPEDIEVEVEEIELDDEDTRKVSKAKFNAQKKTTETNGLPSEHLEDIPDLPFPGLESIEGTFYD